MVCKHCGKETSYVICDNCGVNVIWYNKYGFEHDKENPGEIELFDTLSKDTKSEMTIEDFLNKAFENYDPDGSGD